MAYNSLMNDLIMKSVRKSGVDKETGGYAAEDEREEEEEGTGGAHSKQHKNKPSPTAAQREQRAEKQKQHTKKEVSARANTAKRVPTKNPQPGLPGKGGKGGKGKP